MAVDGVDDEPRLGCGRLIDDVWERIGLPPNEHEASCADCQRARANLSELSRLTQSMRARDEGDPDLRPGAGLKTSIMDLARAEVRRGQLLPLRAVRDSDEVPALTISEQTVAGVVRIAADTMPGLHAWRCSVRADEDSIVQPAVTAAPGDHTLVPDAASVPVDVVVELSVAVAVGTPLPSLTAQLRRRVADQVLTTTGLRVRALNIRVEDLFDA